MGLAAVGQGEPFVGFQSQAELFFRSVVSGEGKVYTLPKMVGCYC
jgi:hypothetical protein